MEDNNLLWDDNDSDNTIPWEDDEDEPAGNLPSNPDQLFALVRDQTAELLELHWLASVCEAYNPAGMCRAASLRAKAYDALGAEKADEAVEAGRRNVAEGFTDQATREIFLHGTSLQRRILETETKLACLKSELAKQESSQSLDPMHPTGE
jgi:hypothetical protein